MEFYRSEDIAMPELAFNDNQDVLDLIMKKSVGIISILDEEGLVPRGSTEGFLNKLVKAHGTNKRFGNKSRTREFAVNHYAGEVIYDPSLFLSKNKDTLSQDLVEVMKLSSYPFIAGLFADEGAAAGGGLGQAGGQVQISKPWARSLVFSSSL